MPEYKPSYTSSLPLSDFDEWKQVIVINMLIRYGRSQFLNPNIMPNAEQEDDEAEFNYLDHLDPDHRMLLKNAKPLLQSRNSAVVMAVIQLYLYLAPNSELNSTIVRPLIRLLHSKPEIQIVVLTNIVSLTTTPEESGEQAADDEDEATRTDENRDPDADFLLESNNANKSNQLSLKALFEPLLKSFFVKSKDPTQVRILKLKILTNLSSSYNIPLILREFQAYINNYQDDMEFVSATIEAIGKCASRIKEIASVCLNGLISLLSNRNEAIIAQSIIVIRKQIINKQRQIDRKLLLSNGSPENVAQDGSRDDLKGSPTGGKRKRKDDKSDHIISLVIKQVSKLVVDKIKTPNAKATVLWILAEFCDKNVKAYQLSPDILRLVAKSFTGEQEIVKLQAINLAAKVYLTTCYFETSKNYFSDADKERIKLLINYIFNLAKYDLNYDVRDRARFLRQLLNKSNTNTGLLLAQKVLMAPKNIFIENNKPDELNGQLTEDHRMSTGDYTELPDEPNSELATRPAAAPSLVNSGMSKYRIGTLSHFLGKAVNNYEELPDFPTERPDPTVRNSRVEEEERALDRELDLSSPIKKKLNRTDSSENFYSGSSDLESGSSDSEESGSSSSSGSGSEEESSESEEDEESEEETPKKLMMNHKKAAPVQSKPKKPASESSGESESGSSEDSEEDSGSSESDSSLSSGDRVPSRTKPGGQVSKDKLIKC